MKLRLPGFKGEFLWEFDIAERQLLALAEAFPAESYGWRPAETARSVSEVLVHVAAGNLLLLGITGVAAAPDLYGKLVPKLRALIRVAKPRAQPDDSQVARMPKGPPDDFCHSHQINN